MLPTSQIAEAVAVKGGPPEYVEKNQEHLNRVAQQLVEIYKEQTAGK
jgi:hypothetical protein